MHEVTAYARSVVAGETVACHWVRLACERHLRDLETGAERGLRFSEEHADYALEFFGFLRHFKGEWGGRPIQLEPWQKFIIGSVFGWLRAEGLRRFRTVYVEIPRKNGKSTLAGGVALFLLLADGEPGAEIYSAATKRDQAKVVFDAAKAMIRRAPELRAFVQLLQNNINVPATESFMIPLSSDAKTMDGLNGHGIIYDEVHAHRTREVIDVLDESTAARSQPLQFEITTAGEAGPDSICWEHHNYSEGVLEQIYDDAAADEWFAYIATLDKGDDWRDPLAWAKANPNFGISVKPDYLQGKVQKAIASPAGQVSTRRKHFNEWVSSHDRAIDMELWAAGAEPFDLEELAGRDCYFGLDLARVSDLSALALLFPPMADNEKWKVACRFWCPEDDIERRSHDDRVPYRTWCEQGYITATPGNATDFRFIEQEIIELAGVYNLIELSYDRAFAEQLIQNLAEHLGEERIVPFGQGFLSMGNATAAVFRWLRQRSLQHGGNPVLSWCARNLVCAKDPADNLKPDKKHSREKIDGMTALFNAGGRAVLLHEPGSTTFGEEDEVMVA